MHRRVVGLFSKQNRVTYKLGGRWEELWKARPPMVGGPVRSAQDAFHRLGDMANVSGATAGDALVVAIEIVSAVDRQGDYAKAMSELRKFFERGDLRTVRDEPLDKLMTWPAVVELAEAACRMARPLKVMGWGDRMIRGIGHGETHPDDLFSLAPVTGLDAYRLWSSELDKLESLSQAERDEDDEYDEKVVWMRNVVTALDPYVRL